MYRIGTEAEAFDMLERALRGEISDDHLRSIEFDQWPRMDVYLPKTAIQSSISPSMMEAFLEVQTSLHRTYALLTSDTTSIRGLTKPEKEILEFRVRVSGGSSEYLADFAKPLETIGAGLVNKMDPNGAVIVVLGCALVLGGVVAWKAWLKYKAEQRAGEVHKDEVKTFLDGQATLMQHDERMAGLLAEALKRHPILEDVEAVAEPARQAIVKAVGEERGGNIQGLAVSQEFASEITAQQRQQSTIESVSGTYRVAKVDTTAPDGFRVTFANIEDGAEVTASLQDTLVSEQHRDRIRDAEWSKQPIRVSFRVRRLRNRYVEAVVTDVQSVPLSPRAAS